MSSQGQPSPQQAKFYSQEWRPFSLLRSFLFPPDSWSQNVCVSCLQLCLSVPREPWTLFVCTGDRRTDEEADGETEIDGTFWTVSAERRWMGISCLLCLHKRSPFVFQQDNQAFHREPGQPCCCCLEGCSHTSMHRSILIVLVCICHLGWVRRWHMRQSSGRSHCSASSLQASVGFGNFTVSPSVTFSTECTLYPGVAPANKTCFFSKNLFMLSPFYCCTLLSDGSPYPPAMPLIIVSNTTACRVFENHRVKKNFIALTHKFPDL